jgi:demethylmenaquinone methyltransferase/2-methoxy-6-polyprenyl-1,4-benzoquinol methylase
VAPVYWAISRGREKPRKNARTKQDDCYKPDKITEKYNSPFAGFWFSCWFSHVSKSRINDFLKVIHRKLNENATVVFMDNLYVEGSSTPISRVDTEGNSYQIRKLKDNIQPERYLWQMVRRGADISNNR